MGNSRTKRRSILQLGKSLNYSASNRHQISNISVDSSEKCCTYPILNSGVELKFVKIPFTDSMFTPFLKFCAPKFQVVKNGSMHFRFSTPFFTNFNFTERPWLEWWSLLAGLHWPLWRRVRLSAPTTTGAPLWDITMNLPVGMTKPIGSMVLVYMLT